MLKCHQPLFEANQCFSNRLVTIKETNVCSVYQTVDVKVEILTKPETKQAILHDDKTRYKVDCIVADDTGSIKLVLWENAINAVNAGKSYRFENVKVRIFDDEKYINTNEYTVIKAIDDVQYVNLSTPALKDNILEGSCCGIEIKKSVACILHNKTFPEDCLLNTEEITCQNCKITTMLQFCKTKIICQILIKSEQNISSYTCFNDVVQSFF